MNVDVLKRICELQPRYSPTNTPEMKERGKLIRDALADELHEMLPRISAVVGDSAQDLSVDSSDGIGRKTEAPWVRVHSKSLSPNPREGYYFVIHFRADGTGVFFTVGCGSTVWNGGDLRPVSDKELAQRTGWARSVIEQRWKTVAPFEDRIQIGASAALPRTFEKATVVAKRVDVGDLGRTDLDALVLEACARLGEIYRAQRDLRDVQPAEQVEAEVVVAVNPTRRSSSRQGFGLSGAERKAVELRAMLLATEHLMGMGFVCNDTSSSESFDLLACKGEEKVKVEVKGTTSDSCDAIVMTANEVRLHSLEKGATGLIMVSRIRLRREDGKPIAEGGQVEALLGWDIGDWQSDPIAFRVSRRS